MLVFLGVLLIPMLLSGPGNRPVKQPVALPDSDAVQTVRIPLKKPDEAANSGAPATGQASAEVTAIDPVASTVEPEKAPVQPPAEPENAREVPAGTATVSSEPSSSQSPAGESRPSGAWTVQVGSFSQPENAETLAAELRDMDYPAFVQPFDDGSRMHYRVRIGGYADREAAAAKAAEIKQRTGEPARPAMND